MVRETRGADHASHRTPARRHAMNGFMNLIARRTQPARLHVPVPMLELALVDIEEPDDDTADDEAFSRCGWFDSSLELAAGLQVTEFTDALPEDMPFEVAQ
jgi:hypothetical protein